MKFCPAWRDLREGESKENMSAARLVDGLGLDGNLEVGGSPGIPSIWTPPNWDPRESIQCHCGFALQTLATMASKAAAQNKVFQHNVGGIVKRQVPPTF